MDPDEIVRLVNEMKISRLDPNDAVNLEEDDIRIGEERLNRCLVAKVLSSKAINREVFRQQMHRILQAERRMDIEATDDNTFVFEFHSFRDRNRALKEVPWNFSRNLVLRKCIHVSAMREEEDSIILLVYERLSDFCYACGRLGHYYRECDESADKVQHAFGIWMRASTHLGGGRGLDNRGSRTNGTRTDATSREYSGQMDSQALLNIVTEGNENEIPENSSKDCHNTSLQVIKWVLSKAVAHK